VPKRIHQPLVTAARDHPSALDSWPRVLAARDGIDYGDYIEQLTYLLFLKMSDEREVEVPKGCEWTSLEALSGTALTDHYADILRTLREKDRPLTRKHFEEFEGKLWF
jgi:hypothetical protein